MLAAVQIPVIASGGIGSLEDLRALKALAAPNLEGVVVGKALYTGALNPQTIIEEIPAWA